MSRSTTSAQRISCGSGKAGPIGLDRRQGVYVAWYYKNRWLGRSQRAIRELAAKERIPGRFADKIWTSSTKRTPGSKRLTVTAGCACPRRPPHRVKAKARAGCDDLYKALRRASGVLREGISRGGAGDESPLTFTIPSQGRQTQHYGKHWRSRRPGRGPITPGPVKFISPYD